MSTLLVPPVPRARVPVTLETVAALARGVRLATRGLNAPVLLSPERGLVLNETAADIVRLLDGRRSVGDVARLLKERYAGRGEMLASDVVGLIEELALLALLTLRQPSKREA